MDKKSIGIIVAVVVVVLAGVVFYTSNKSKQNAETNAQDYLNSSSSTDTKAMMEDGKVTPVSETDTTKDAGMEAKDGAAMTPGEYKVVTADTKLAWIGKKTAVAGYQDAGKIDVKSGTIMIVDGKVTKAEITLDMATIATLKAGKENGESMLTKHLQSPDFFDVEKFPTATFSLTEAKFIKAQGNDSLYDFKGNLTMKGITAEVMFPGAVVIDGDTATLTADAMLDRTKWGINYGSSKLANAFIDDKFDLKIKAVAKAAK